MDLVDNPPNIKEQMMMLSNLMLKEAGPKITDELGAQCGVFFVKTKKIELNPDAMAEYGLVQKDQSGSENQNKFLVEGEVEFIERFDGRGRKVRIKKGKIENPQLYKI